MTKACTCVRCRATRGEDDADARLVADYWARLRGDTVAPTLGLPTDAKARKALPIYSGVLCYFPDALAEVARVSKAGNDQHNPGQPLHWSKGKSTDHDDCALRHLMDAKGNPIDTDGGRHRAKHAWRALAALQIEIEAEAAGMTYEAYIAKLEADYA